MLNQEIVNELININYTLEGDRFTRENLWILIDEIKFNKLTKEEIITKIDKIKESIEGNRFAKENLGYLKSDIQTLCKI